MRMIQEKGCWYAGREGTWEKPGPSVDNGGVDLRAPGRGWGQTTAHDPSRVSGTGWVFPWQGETAMAQWVLQKMFKDSF